MSEAQGLIEKPPNSEALMQRLVNHWPTVVVLTVVGGLLGAGLGFLLASQQTSTTTVFVSSLEASPFSPDPRGQTLTNLETEAQVVRSDEVMQRAAQALGGDITPESVFDAVDVSIPPGSQVLAITFTENGSVSAQDGADAVADAYLTVRSERAVAAIEERRARIVVEEEAARTELAAAAAAVSAAAPGSPEAQVAQERITVASGTLSTLAGERSTLAVTSTSPGEVLAPGSTPTTPFPYAEIALGALLGLLLGAGIAIGRGADSGPSGNAHQAISDAGQ